VFQHLRRIDLPSTILDHDDTIAHTDYHELDTSDEGESYDFTECVHSALGSIASFVNGSVPSIEMITGFFTDEAFGATSAQMRMRRTQQSEEINVETFIYLE
jgi:hypothetical protein